ncbi:MAG TPA: hypothetical protein VEO00_07035 [Actinomycetota bacterium]|nr:hypothetical protein [Actinomycetota bacterium]
MTKATADRIGTWSEEAGVRIAGRSVEGAGFRLDLEIARAGAPVAVVSDDGATGRVECTIVAPAAAGDPALGLSARVADLDRAGSGLLKAVLEPPESVTISHALYLDDLDRQAFLAALWEVAKVAETVRLIAGVAPAAPADVAAAEPEPAVTAPAGPEPAAVAPAERPAVAMGPVEQPAPVMPAQPAAQPAQPAAAPIVPGYASAAAPATAAAPPWVATHVVPATGIATYLAPDPNAVGPTLQPGVELQVLERLGDWARVMGSNGWTGWVDARWLAPR